MSPNLTCLAPDFRYLALLKMSLPLLGLLNGSIKKNEIFINLVNNSFRLNAVWGLQREDECIMGARSAYLCVTVFLCHDNKGRN